MSWGRAVPTSFGSTRRRDRTAQVAPNPSREQCLIGNTMAQIASGRLTAIEFGCKSNPKKRRTPIFLIFGWAREW
jgi:hypothetical protein